MDKRFKEKVAVMTGGAHGIGKAGLIRGENIRADGDMTKLMLCHGEHGWSYAE